MQFVSSKGRFCRVAGGMMGFFLRLLAFVQAEFQSRRKRQLMHECSELTYICVVNLVTTASI